MVGESSLIPGRLKKLPGKNHDTVILNIFVHADSLI